MPVIRLTNYNIYGETTENKTISLEEEDKVYNVARTPKDELVLMILRRRDKVLQLLNEYLEMKNSNSFPMEYKLKSAIQTLYFDVKVPLEEFYKKKGDGFDHIQELMRSANIAHNIQAFEFIDGFLYTKHVTKFDVVEKYDRRSIELENKKKGLN